MKILLVGATGKLGKALGQQLHDAGHELLAAAGRKHFDLSNIPTARTCIEADFALCGVPEVIINCAAMNGLEACNADPGMAYAMNAAVPAMLAALARKHNAWFIHFSTDYVFNYVGRETAYNENDICSPCGDYGWSKREGENAVMHLGHAQKTLIFRVSTLYDESCTGPLHPVGQVQYNGGHAIPISIFHQVCAPTSVNMVARAVTHVIANLGRARSKLYHLTTSQGVSRGDFVRYALKRVYGGDAWVFKIIDMPIRRPEFSVLRCARFEHDFDYPLPTWKQDFDQCKAPPPPS